MARKSKKFQRLFRLTPVKLFIIAGALILVTVLSYAYFHNRKSASQTVVTAGKPAAAVKNNVSSQQSSPAKSSSNTTSSPTGTATDTHGEVSASTDSSKWITSKSGAITLKQPLADSKLQNGGALSGSASVDNVNYRLIDNSAGVIATGGLSVKNGNFSGTLQFTPTATSGRLDVYSTDPDTGVEINEIEVYVSF